MVGVIVGGAIGGATGGGGGAVVCSPSGPGAAFCSVGGATTLGILGAIAGGGTGAIVGTTVGGNSFPCQQAATSPQDASSNSTTLVEGQAGWGCQWRTDRKDNQ